LEFKEFLITLVLYFPREIQGLLEITCGYNQYVRCDFLAVIWSSFSEWKSPEKVVIEL